VLEPVSFGERYRGQHTDGHTPLDRLVDTVVADPPSRFEIAQDVDAVVNKAPNAAEAEARLMARFMEWQRVSPTLAAQMQQNSRMSDASIRATQLGELGSVGIAILQKKADLNQAHSGPYARFALPQDQLAAIDQAAKPAALVRFTFLDSLRKLVTANQQSASGATTPPAQP
jgi:hexosaminidase